MNQKISRVSIAPGFNPGNSLQWFNSVPQENHFGLRYFGHTDAKTFEGELPSPVYPYFKDRL